MTAMKNQNPFSIKIILGKQLEIYQTWQATEELYFSHIEAKLEEFSGTTNIQRSKKTEANKGFIKF